VSLSDDLALPGESGISYHDPDLVTLESMDPHDQFTLSVPHGLIDITEIPPPCPCEYR